MPSGKRGKHHRLPLRLLPLQLRFRCFGHVLLRIRAALVLISTRHQRRNRRNHRNQGGRRRSHHLASHRLRCRCRCRIVVGRIIKLHSRLRAPRRDPSKGSRRRSSRRKRRQVRSLRGRPRHHQRLILASSPRRISISRFHPVRPRVSHAAAARSGGISDLVMDNDLFSGSGIELGSSVPAFTAERFQQGSAITTSASTPLLIDVTPLSLGVETAGGYADVLIPANSPVPCEKTRTFLTASDNQSMVSIRVAQGQSSRFMANARLGDLELSGLRQARRGEVKIVVTFELDADGILNVSARDHDTGRETKATMRLLGTSSEAEDMVAMVQRQARHVVA
jgi:hypothetical protein